MKTKKALIWFGLLYFFLFFYRGTYGSYIGIYLRENLHLSYAEVGLIGALGSLSAMILVPLSGLIADKTKRFKLVVAALLLFLLILTYLYAQVTTLLMAVLIGMLFDGISESNIPINDSLVMVYTEENGGNYGSIRGTGSFGYIVGSLVGGFILTATGQNGYLFVLTALSIIIVLGILKMIPNTNQSAAAKINLKKDIFELLKNRSFISILIIMLATIAINNATGNYATLHLTETLKGSKDLVGIMTFAMVIPEVIIVTKARDIYRRFGYKKTFFIAALAFFLRWTISFLVRSPLLFIIGSPFHSIGMGLLLAANLSFIKETVNPNIFASAVSVYSGVAFFAIAVFRLIEGLLMDALGSYSTFLMAMIVIFIGLLYILFLFKEPRGQLR